jgi:crossover junction endodeoxyribonuclease RusA
MAFYESFWSQIVFDFYVEGRPAPQGSKKSVGRGRFVEASKYLPAWRAAVVEAARSAFVGEKITTPVRVRIVVFLEKPKKPKFDSAPGVMPDADKLARGILDSLKIAEIYEDDALVVSLEIDKMWAIDQPQGAYVSVVTIK